MSESAARVALNAVGHTDIGQRSHNEDLFLINLDIGLLAVADGVGGHQAGEVASAITCKVIERESTAGSTLAKGIKSANLEVAGAVAKELGRAGMASTVVALQFHGLAWELAWVGDSRAYLWDGQLGLLSSDHSLVEGLVRTGQITLQDARTHPKKNVIDQAIGLQGEDNLKIGTNRGVIESGQVLLLCSDGLNDVLDSAEICAILAMEESLEQRCKTLVSTAIRAGGRDNTTVILVEADSQDTARGSGPEPQFTWRYDPATASYTGLPKLRRKPSVRDALPDTLDGTQMIKAPVFEEPDHLTTKAASVAGMGLRLLLAAVVLGSLAVAAWKFL